MMKKQKNNSLQLIPAQTGILITRHSGEHRNLFLPGSGKKHLPASASQKIL
jgi:hypothetical protein